MESGTAWPDHVQRVMAGDLVTVFAYTTPAGGAVLLPVSPTGLVDRDAGRIAMTTSLAFPGKLRHVRDRPEVAMAYHTREHGFADDPGFVLAQGTAMVDLTPDPERLAALRPQVARFLGADPTGRFWDWLLREYLDYRVFLDIPVHRVAVWHDGSGPEVHGAIWPAPPAPQRPPAKGTAPRVDAAKMHRRMSRLPHQLIAYVGADGLPVVLPVTLTGHDARGLHLRAPGLPDGGRRAGLAAHSFGPKATALANRAGTGWLEAHGGEAIWSPHTTGGFTVPPIKLVQTLGNGLLAKQGIRTARRRGLLPR
ncbi:hypothetical protein [Catenuloplanes japonicus]|uniref:hypothetical protein n=1 Tax=Catenuloplanes japonicus TaxID=33876 RepID=UPI0005257FB9|nr:hypothetical protein [Catenuloplanes japonicus]